MFRSTTSLLVLFTFAACTAESTEDPGAGVDAQGAIERAQDAADTVSTRTIATPEVHDAKCGHLIEGVGHCSNYVMLDGKWVEIEWSEFGRMEWCSKGEAGAKIEITGAREGDKFVATSYREVE